MAKAIAKGIERYENGGDILSKEEALKIIQERCGFDDNTMLYLQMYRYADSLITRLAEQMK